MPAVCPVLVLKGAWALGDLPNATVRAPLPQFCSFFAMSEFFTNEKLAT